MKLEIETPATILDIAHLCEGRSMRHWLVEKHMLERSRSYAVRVAGELIAVCFVYPLGDGNGEACFDVAPAAAPHILRLCRWMRFTLGRLPYRGIVAVVTSPEGARLARASGFVPAPENPLGDVWGYVRTDQRHLRGRRRGGSRAESGDGQPAKPIAGDPGPAAGRD